MADHTALAAETQRLSAAAYACWLAWAEADCAGQTARAGELWRRYSWAWQAYLEVARKEAQEAAEAIAGRTAEL